MTVGTPRQTARLLERLLITVGVFLLVCALAALWHISRTQKEINDKAAHLTAALNRNQVQVLNLSSNLDFFTGVLSGVEEAATGIPYTHIAPERARAVAKSLWYRNETLPDHVPEAINKQIQDYFGNADLTGIPLLDPEINWNAITNWPEEFTYGGRRYYMQLAQDRSSRSRPKGFRFSSLADLTPGMSISVRYRHKPDDMPPGISPTSTWGVDGTIRSRGVRTWQTTVFDCYFYESGALYRFSRYDIGEGITQIEYFDPDGSLVGMALEKRTAFGFVTRYLLHDRDVDVDTFYGHLREVRGLVPTVTF